jgi:protein SCO1/2
MIQPTRLFAPFLATALLASCGQFGEPRFHGTAYPDAPPAASFTLTDHNGQSRSLADLRGQPVLLFFGFTHCPDVCPLTLARLSRVLQSMGSRGEQVRVLLVSVDPERDTPPVLARYVSQFGPQVTGLTGEADVLRQMRTQYGAYAEHGGGHGAGEHTDVMHTNAVYGIDRAGKLRVLIAPDGPEEQMRDDIRTLLRI